MININSDYTKYIHADTDIVEVIKIIALLDVAQDKKNKTIFKQYYKNLNLPGRIHSIEKTDKNTYMIYSSLLTLIGSHGILPSHYTHRVVDSVKDKDLSLIGFLDVFYHQIMKIFSKIIINCDLLENIKHYNLSHQKCIPKVIKKMFSIVGIKSYGYSQHNNLGILIKELGMFSISTRPKLLLEFLLSKIFGLKVVIKEFLPLKKLIKEIQQQTDSDLRYIRNASQKPSTPYFHLSTHSYIGKYIYLYQNNIRITFYDLDCKKHYNFIKMLKSKKNFLEQILDSYLGRNITYNIKLLFKNTIHSTLSKKALGVNSFLYKK